MMDGDIQEAVHNLSGLMGLLIEIDARIGLLRPNPKNARTHSPRQLKRIAASIEQFGFLNPILVDDGNMIFGGHGRLAAARILGMDQVPVVRFSHLSEAQKRA